MSRSEVPVPGRSGGAGGGDGEAIRELRRLIQEGIDALDRGDYLEVADADLEAALDEMARTHRR